MDVESKLEEAIDDGEVLRIVYSGGSQPGAERDIAPISIKNGKVRAKCYASDAVKSFVIGKITVLGSANGSSGSWSPEKENMTSSTTIKEAIKILKEEWVQQGWIVESDNECVSLHQIGKRGKPLKTPTVELYYTEETSESVYNYLTDEIEELNRRPRTRPWTLHAKGFETKTFKHLDSAIATMREWAKLIAPGTQ